MQLRRERQPAPSSQGNSSTGIAKVNADPNSKEVLRLPSDIATVLALDVALVGLMENGFWASHQYHGLPRLIGTHSLATTLSPTSHLMRLSPASRPDTCLNLLQKGKGVCWQMLVGVMSHPDGRLPELKSV